MADVGVDEAQTRLSDLLRRVAAGEEITITDDGLPVARLVPAPRRAPRVLGQDAGSFTVPDDFDASLPDEVLRDFER